MYINDKSTVFYCDEDNCIPLAEVWSKIGLPGYMDTSVMVIDLRFSKTMLKMYKYC